LFAASVVVLLLGLAGDLRQVAAAVLTLAIVVMGGWLVISRPGGRRLLAAGVAVAGLVIFALLLLTIWRAVVLASVVALAALSVMAAGYALRTAREIGDPLVPGPAAPPARAGVLIMNLKSGGGKAERFELERRCRERGIEPVVLRPGDDLLQLAEDAVARGADVIGMAGGDGSQALVASVAARHGVPHVVIPAGTRNHFALDLGLDRDDVVGALDAYEDGVERTIDLAEVNGRVFVNNASMGLYAKVVQSTEYRDAKVATAADMLPALLGPDATPLDLRFTGPSGAESPTAHLILVSNNAYDLHHLRGGGTRERIDAGVLGVVAVVVGGAADAAKLAGLEAVGQVDRFGGWQEWTASEFEVRSGEPVEIGVDGEALVIEPPLLFSIRPGALRVRLPRSAAGVSPAARTVRVADRATLGQLWSLAIGRTGEG
jgi:diacylglycerol kinase family enzyme